MNEKTPNKLKISKNIVMEKEVKLDKEKVD